MRPTMKKRLSENIRRKRLRENFNNEDCYYYCIDLVEDAMGDIISKLESKYKFDLEMVAEYDNNFFDHQDLVLGVQDDLAHSLADFVEYVKNYYDNYYENRR